MLLKLRTPSNNCVSVHGIFASILHTQVSQHTDVFAPMPAPQDETLQFLAAAAKSTHPFELSRSGQRSAGVLAAGLGISGLPGAEAAVTREAIGAVVKAISAAAPDFFEECLSRARAVVGDEDEAIARTPAFARGMAARVLLAQHPVWRERPFAYAWLVRLHSAADPLVMGLLEAEQAGTVRAFEAALDADEDIDAEADVDSEADSESEIETASVD